MPKSNRHSVARGRIAACIFELRSDETGVQLLPDGQFRARDGRPHDAPGWLIDAAVAERLIARTAAQASATVIDYEHQSLWTELNGQPAPAAGWFT
ncbi:MAG: hypothetical protein J5I81_09720, partial [Nitrococcus mobilis]|nr:hypothetical protein [Nitrococcus mobilis]